MQIGGIGKVTEHILRDVLGINTCEEILKKSAYLCGLFSPCSIGQYIVESLFFYLKINEKSLFIYKM